MSSLVKLYVGGMLAIFPGAYTLSAGSEDPVMKVVMDLVTWPMLYTTLPL